MAQSLIPFPEPSQLIWPVEDIFPFLQKNVVTDGQRRRGADNSDSELCLEGRRRWKPLGILADGKAHVQSKKSGTTSSRASNIFNSKIRGLEHMMFKVSGAL